MKRLSLFCAVSFLFFVTALSCLEEDLGGPRYGMNSTKLRELGESIKKLDDALEKREEQLSEALRSNLCFDGTCDESRLKGTATVMRLRDAEARPSRRRLRGMRMVSGLNPSVWS